MNNLREALIRIIHGCRRSIHLAEIFHSEITGGCTNAFDDLAGEIEDSLYLLCNEHTQTLEESIVDRLLRDHSLSDELVADTLCGLVKIK